MDKRLCIYFTPSRLNIEVENGISRSTVGKPTEVLKSMHVDDLGVLVAFCRAVCKSVDSPNEVSMFLDK